MAWEKDGYYRRTRRVDGCFVRTYHGGGERGAAAAAEDAARREELRRRRDERIAERARLAVLDGLADAACAFVDAELAAVLGAAGYHEDDGVWRVAAPLPRADRAAGRDGA